MNERHAHKLERISKQVRRFARVGRPVSFRKRAVSHQVPKANDPRRDDERVDLTDLDEILELADRVAVMSGGTINYVAPVGATDRATIGRHMAGH